MMIRLLAVLLLSLVAQGWEKAGLVWASSQENNHDAVVQDEFFSGTVQEVGETTISVSRTLSGRSPETRVFQMDSETIVEGRLKKLVRVTVGYRTHDGQDHAWRIIVRESPD